MKPSLYGKYAGRLKYSVDYLSKCSELELFIQVSSLYYPLTMMEYSKKMVKFYENTEDIASKKYFEERISNLNIVLRKENTKEYNDFIYALDYCILQTARFNTNVVYNPKGRIIITEEFKNWYNNWQLYIASMDDETLALYRTCRYQGKGLEKFHLDKPIEKEKVINEIDGAIPKQYLLNKKSIKQKFA